MKIYKNLWAKIIDIDNFKKAYYNAVKGKQHYKEVKYIQNYGVNKYLRELREEVINKTYRVSEYTVFQLYTGGKWREIYKLPMRDRIVQHAIMRIIEPIFRETFILDTYSSIKYKGIHLGLSRVKHALRTHPEYKYILKLDIHKCYPSIDKQILKVKLARKFHDKDLNELFEVIIDSCDKGLPIGNYTSQYFNNFYFNDFDHWLKEVKGIKAYFRYCDDMVILGETKEELHFLLKEIMIKMEELHVSLKSNYQVSPIEDRTIDFLGYRTTHNKCMLRKKTKQNFIKKVSKMNFNNLSAKDINVLGSYWGILKHANALHLWQKYTGMKKFSDLQINVKKPEYVRNLLGVELIVKDAIIYQQKGSERLKLICDYELPDVEGNMIKYENAPVITSGSLLIEAAKQFRKVDYPFSTTVQQDGDKLYYHFT